MKFSSRVISAMFLFVALAVTGFAQGFAIASQANIGEVQYSSSYRDIDVVLGGKMNAVAYPLTTLFPSSQGSYSIYIRSDANNSTRYAMTVDYWDAYQINFRIPDISGINVYGEYKIGIAVGNGTPEREENFRIPHWNVRTFTQTQTVNSTSYPDMLVGTLYRYTVNTSVCGSVLGAGVPSTNCQTYGSSAVKSLTNGTVNPASVFAADYTTGTVPPNYFAYPDDAAALGFVQVYVTGVNPNDTSLYWKTYEDGVSVPVTAYAEGTPNVWVVNVPYNTYGGSYNSTNHVFSGFLGLGYQDAFYFDEYGNPDYITSGFQASRWTTYRNQ